MNAILFILGVSLLGSAPSLAQGNRIPCLADVRNDGEYAPCSGRRWEFYGWEYRHVKGVRTKFLVGERLFSAPVDELENMTSACSKLPKWQMPEFEQPKYPW